MDLQKKKSAFTLIELLVVITIIGILAVGGVTVYTAQIQKARDSTRINDIKALQGAAEQVYQDGGEYPHEDTFSSGGMDSYIERIPEDPKHLKTCAQTLGTNLCIYAYNSSDDTNGIEYGIYEFSTAFESDGNLTNRAGKDNGGDDDRFEVGLSTDSLSTDPTATTVTTGACRALDGTATAETDSGSGAILLTNDC